MKLMKWYPLSDTAAVLYSGLYAVESRACAETCTAMFHVVDEAVHGRLLSATIFLGVAVFGDE